MGLWLKDRDAGAVDKELSHNFSFYINAFKEAQESVLSNFTGDTKDEITKKLISVATCRSTHVIFTAGNLPVVVREVFTDEKFTDFLLSLTINFFIRISVSNQQGVLIEALAKQLAFTEGSGSLVPTEIKQRVASYHDILNILTDNHWLVTYVMITLFTMGVIFDTEAPHEHAK